jgi:hypothetical protein
MKRSFIILLSASAGLAAGFAVRWLQPSPLTTEAPARTKTVAAAANKTPVTNVSGASPNRTMTPLASHLEQQLAVSTGVSRWLEWMSVMEKAKSSDFPDLARLARGNSVVLRMVAARWMEVDRDHLFKTLVAESGNVDPVTGAQAFPLTGLGQQLFEEWSKTDPAAAVAALSGSDCPAQLRDLRYTVLNSVMAKDPEMGLKAMADWKVENYGTGTEGIAKWAAVNPRHAAEYALKYPAGYTTDTAMEVIGREWAKTDAGAGMSFAAGMGGRYGEMLATGILRAWSKSDRGKAAAWLAAADPKVRNRLASPMLEIWAKTDTTGAMDWIQQNLSGSGMDEAVASVLKGAAEISVPDAAVLVTGMDSSLSRAKAATSVAREWWPAYHTNQPVPPEAVAWLSSLDPVSIKHVVQQLQWQWSGSDPKSFTAFLATPAGQHAPEYAFASAAREMAQRDPQEAMEWAARLPDGQRDSTTLSAFMAWQGTQPASAIKWLRQLPAEDPRRETLHFGMVGEFVSDREAAVSIAKTLASGNTSAALKAVQALSITDASKEKLLDRFQIR